MQSDKSIVREGRGKPHPEVRGKSHWLKGTDKPMQITKET